MIENTCNTCGRLTVPDRRSGYLGGYVCLSDKCAAGQPGVAARCKNLIECKDWSLAEGVTLLDHLRKHHADLIEKANDVMPRACTSADIDYGGEPAKSRGKSRPCGCGERWRHKATCPMADARPRPSVAFTRETAENRIDGDPSRLTDPKLEPSHVVCAVCLADPHRADCPAKPRELLGSVTEDVDMPEPPDVPSGEYGLNRARAKRARVKKEIPPPRKSAIPAYKCGACGNRQLTGERCKACFRNGSMGRLNV